MLTSLPGDGETEYRDCQPFQSPFPTFSRWYALLVSRVANINCAPQQSWVWGFKLKLHTHPHPPHTNKNDCGTCPEVAQFHGFVAVLPLPIMLIPSSDLLICGHWPEQVVITCCCDVKQWQDKFLDYVKQCSVQAWNIVYYQNNKISCFIHVLQTIKFLYLFNILNWAFYFFDVLLNLDRLGNGIVCKVLVKSMSINNICSKVLFLTLICCDNGKTV